MTKVLMVCMANLCRSPIARAVAQAKAYERLPRATGLRSLLRLRRPVVELDSAGVHTPPIGEPIDLRAKAVLEQHGYQAGRARSRRIGLPDFQRFDLILAVDAAVLHELGRLCPPAQQHKLHLLLDFAAGPKARDIPDPYFGDRRGFEHVLALCEEGASGLIDALSQGRLTPD